MKWLLLVVMVSPAEDIGSDRFGFETKAGCVAAAEAFVEAYPEFEWRVRPEEQAVEAPVLRPFVECVEATSEPDIPQRQPPDSGTIPVQASIPQGASP